jgi:hypothetical protein
MDSVGHLAAIRTTSSSPLRFRNYSRRGMECVLFTIRFVCKKIIRKFIIFLIYFIIFM